MSWVIVAILPNVSFDRDIISDPIAIVSPDHALLAELRRAQPGLDQVLFGFKDEFGRRRRISVLLRNSDWCDGFSSEAISGFRDAVGLSSYLLGRAKVLTAPHNAKATWADFFEIYPWGVSPCGDYMRASTSALWGHELATKFNGQVAPALPSLRIQAWDIDRPLLSALIQAWRSFYVDGKEDHSGRALFRSMNMAFAAGRMPAGPEIGLYDVGRSIALWVSAFEILAHPGVGYVGRRQVVENIDKIVWCEERINKKKFLIKFSEGKKQTSLQANFPSYIMNKIYDARNAFLHGNQVDLATLELGRRKTLLHSLAGPLYRMAVAQQLGLNPAASTYYRGLHEGPTSDDERLMRGMFYEPALLRPITPAENED